MSNDGSPCNRLLCSHIQRRCVRLSFMSLAPHDSCACMFKHDRVPWFFINVLFKTCVKSHSKKTTDLFSKQFSLKADQKYYGASANFSTFIKLLFVIKIFVLSIFEWPFYTCFTVYIKLHVFSKLYSFLLIYVYMYNIEACI